jgi:hypothetical protein
VRNHHPENERIKPQAKPVDAPPPPPQPPQPERREDHTPAVAGALHAIAAAMAKSKSARKGPDGSWSFE